MKAHSQVKTMLMLRNNSDNFLSRLPPDKEFLNILHDVAFGELATVQAKLESAKRDVSHPEKLSSLLRQAGDVMTRGGQDVKCTTLLECAIGAGDPDMVAMIKPYFLIYSGDEKALEDQLEAYRPCLQAIENEKPYDLTLLLEVIKASPSEEVTAALNKQYDPNSLLHQMLMQFREDVKPQTITNPQMHYNYKTLIHAFEILTDEWEMILSGIPEALYKGDGNWDKCDLFWRQVIGYLQRALPAVDRFAFANSLYDLEVKKESLIRNTKFKNRDESYPDFPALSSSLSGLGFDYGVYTNGSFGNGTLLRSLSWHQNMGFGPRGNYFINYVKQKLQACNQLCSRGEFINRPSV